MSPSPREDPAFSHLQPVYLTGPTAVGKSAVALCLAQKLGGEIVSVDSMQVYRGLDIGTAKPSLAERTQVPHHLVDVVDLPESFDAARFVELVHRAVAGMRARGRRPIFCGGTGLYFKVWLQGLGDSPPGDPQLRAQLEARPLPELLRELAEKDPATHARIDHQNTRRVVRAVEVLRLTGRPFSELRAPWPAAPEAPVLVLRRTPADLRERIDRRVDEMFARGLVTETRRLLSAGLADCRTAMQAIGYRQVVDHLQGRLPLDRTIQLVKTCTRQFAKRQAAWFRNQLAVKWLDWPPGASPEQLADRIAEKL